MDKLIGRLRQVRQTRNVSDQTAAESAEIIAQMFPDSQRKILRIRQGLEAGTYDYDGRIGIIASELQATMTIRRITVP